MTLAAKEERSSNLKGGTKSDAVFREKEETKQEYKQECDGQGM